MQDVPSNQCMAWDGMERLIGRVCPTFFIGKYLLDKSRKSFQKALTLIRKRVIIKVAGR